MNLFVLTSVTQALRKRFLRQPLEDVRAEVGGLRLRFRENDRSSSVAIGLDAAFPWIGRPAGRGPRHSTPDAFAGLLRRRLIGSLIESVERPRGDRRVELRFSTGETLVAEMVPHRANLVLVGADGGVVDTAKRRRGGRGRLVRGEPYRPGALPDGWLDSEALSADELTDALERCLRQGEAWPELLRRRVLGLGPGGTRAVVDEAGADPERAVRCIRQRLEEAARGEISPVIEAPEDPRTSTPAGRFDPAACRLLPWPVAPAEGFLCFERADAAATVGLWFTSRTEAAGLDRVGRGLARILGDELGTVRSAARKAAADRSGFADPDRLRRHAEALLAGLGAAVRRGERVWVPDPYAQTDDDEGLWIEVTPGLRLEQAAGELFRRHRRAVRGLDTGSRRLEELAGREDRLGRILATCCDPPPRGREEIDRLAEAMRQEGLAVGLESARPGRGPAAARTRAEGVRMFTSSDGLEILVGRSGRDNHRLTFKLATPEDFWFHVRGSAGAHVVVRNPQRRPRPPDRTLFEAAAAAAWFSESRNQPRAEVQWTRRKYVRPRKGAPPGTVTVKKAQTTLVRPAAPRTS